MYQCPKCGTLDPIGPFTKCRQCGYQFVDDPSEWPEGKRPVISHPGRMPGAPPAWIGGCLGCLGFARMMTNTSLGGCVTLIAAALVPLLLIVFWVLTGSSLGVVLVVFGLVAAGVDAYRRAVVLRCPAFDTVAGSKCLGLPAWLFGVAGLIAGTVLLLAQSRTPG
jgi:hypothetical protein